MRLNDGQRGALVAVLAAHKSKTGSFFLSGKPGTGKTTLLGEIVRSFHKMGLRIAVCASDNSAVVRTKQGARKAGWLQLPKLYATAHSLLGLYYDPEEKVVSDSGRSKAEQYDIVIVDESSKLHPDLVNSLVKKCKFVLFVGDKDQLNPVGESVALAFEREGVSLTQIMRQNDNNLLAAISESLDLVHGKKDTFDATKLADYAMFDVVAWQDQITGKEDEMALCFTNDEAARINRVVRKKLGRVNEYEAGDRVIFAESWYTRRADGRYKLAFPANSIGTIVDAKRCRVHGYYCWSLRVKTSETEDYCLVFDNEFDHRHWNEYLAAEEKHEREQAKLEKRQAPKIQKPKVAQVKFAYAITVHRGMGWEWRKVFVQMRDFSRCLDDDTRNRLLYVALSRPREELSILVYEHQRPIIEKARLSAQK